MSFSLDDYKNDTYSVKKQSSHDWVNNGSTKTKLLYKFVMQEFDRIVDAIKSGNKLKINERRIIKLKVAALANVDKSLVSVRRQPQIVELIEGLNNEIQVIWNRLGQRSTSAKKLNKKELELEVSRLKREIKKQKNLNMKAYLLSAIEMELTDNNIKIIKELAKYKALYLESIDTIENLRSGLRKAQIKGIT